ncbi:MAG: amino acid ABC transporter ATP-binding protein [Protaetiibacter sp.]
MDDPETVGTVVATGVHKHFGEQHVLRGVDLRIERGQVVSLLGRSGSGKSTFLRCINELETIDRGKLRVNGQYVGVRRHGDRYVELTEREACQRRERIGMVFQQFNLFPHMTALENIIEAPVGVQRRPRAEMVQRARELLSTVGLLDKADAYPRTLSGGEQQRVAIARALAMDPSVMLFDEPTSALDPQLVGEVLAVIRKLAHTGMTLVIVTHEMHFARDISDLVVFLDEGRVLEAGPPSQVFGDPHHERTREFIQGVLSSE